MFLYVSEIAYFEIFRVRPFPTGQTGKQISSELCFSDSTAGENQNFSFVVSKLLNLLSSINLITLLTNVIT